MLTGHLNADKRQKPGAQTEGCPNGSFRGSSNGQAFLLDFLETSHFEHPLPYASGFRYYFFWYFRPCDGAGLAAQYEAVSCFLS